MITDARSVLEISPVIPVVSLDQADDAVPLARALVRGGVSIMEVTLRTAAALDAVRAIAADVPELHVGVGTVTRPDEVEAAVSAGAEFLVSPGTPPTLMAELGRCDLPVLPGVSTVTEMLAAAEHGFENLKFFPATAAGGPDFLTAVTGPLPGLRFCPTGGITEESGRSWLRLPNVACVGGSWLTSPRILANQAWDEVTRVATRAAELADAAPR